MKHLSIIEKLFATNITLIGLVALAFIPEDTGSNDAGAIGWGIYFCLVFVVMTLVIRSWIDFAEYRLSKFRMESFHAEEEPPLGCVLPAPSWEDDDLQWEDDHCEYCDSDESVRVIEPADAASQEDADEYWRWLMEEKQADEKGGK